MSRVTPTLIPKRVTLEQYRFVLKESNFFIYLKNSVVISTSVMLLTLILASTAAFAISKISFLGKRFIAGSFILAYLFPGILLIVPLFGIAVKAHLYDRLLGVITMQVLYTFPFAIWLLRAFFDEIPTSLSDAAKVDGASYFRILWKVFLPLVAPAFVTVGTYAFILSWNEYMFSLVILSAETKKTVSLGISAWTTATFLGWGPIVAAAILCIIPAAILFTFIHKYFVRGISAGALKG
jgi:multiple sugar transport system permease protein